MVKSFELVPRPLEKSPEPRQIILWFNLHGIILEENQLVQNQKESLKEHSWFGEPKCKLGSKVVFLSFLLFSTVFFNPCCSNFVKMEDMLWIEDIAENTHFLPISELTWLVL